MNGWDGNSRISILVFLVFGGLSIAGAVLVVVRALT